MFIAALFTIAKIWKQKKIHKQMNGQKEEVYGQHGIVASEKK